MNDQIFTRVTLIGGGPATCTAAIQLTRAGVDCVLITEELGGKIRNANLIENLLGFPNGISGEDYIKIIKDQLKQLKVRYLVRKANAIEYKRIEYNAKRFVVKTQKEDLISEYLIIGTGSIPKKLNIEGEEKLFKEKKLFYEIYNAKKYAKEKNIAIIGGGDVAYDYALNLCNSAEHISIILRSTTPKSIPVLQDRVRRQENIRVLLGVNVNKIKLEGKKLVINAEKKERAIPILTDLAIVAIGREPNLEILSSDLKEVYDKKRELPYLFFVGDVKQENYRQVSIAIGDGMNTAMNIVNNISEEEGYHGASRDIW